MASLEKEIRKEQDSHNKNCFNYLQAIALAQPTAPAFKRAPLNALRLNPQEFQEYIASIPYGNRYAKFLTALEKQLEPIDSPLRIFLDKASTEQKRVHRNWINAIYDNPGNLLKATYQTFQETFKNRHLTDGLAENIIKKNLRHQQDASKVNPKASSHPVSLAQDNFGPTYKPMLKTGLATQINYSYKENVEEDDATKAMARELRLATQAERHWGRTRISPLFLEWLQVNRVPPTVPFENPEKEDKELPEPEITHVYFNLLKRDAPKGMLDSAALNESWFSSKLEALEHNPLTPNILVITLPAHRGIFSEHLTFSHKKTLTKQAICQAFLDIAKGRQKAGRINDFYLSPKAKEMLYKELPEEARLDELIKNSFKALGLDEQETLSPSQQQALWFHFTKFEFPCFVLNTVPAKTFNFTCKDGIDRGAIASSYFNLISSIEHGLPLSEDEFYQANHAAAAMVKGRGLNYHNEFLFNAVYHFVLNSQEQILQDAGCAWLVDWLSDNVPHHALDHDFIQNILTMQRKRVQQAKLDRRLTEQGLKSFTLIERQLFDEKSCPILISGRRLLLDSASTLSKTLLSHGKPAHVEKLKKLAEHLKHTPRFVCLSLSLAKAISYVLQRCRLGRWLEQEVEKRHNAYIKHAENRQNLSQSLCKFFNPTRQPATIELTPVTTSKQNGEYVKVSR
jgi:hypothetical protein